MKVYGELEVAFAESVAGDPSTGTQNGRFYYDSNANVLKARVNGAWKTIATTDVAFANPMTTDGDMVYGGASGAATRLAPPSTDGGWLVYDLASTKPSWSRTTIFENAETNVATTSAWSFIRKTSGTAAAGFGGRIELAVENASGNFPAAAYMQWRLTTATDGAEVSEYSVWTRTGGAALAANLLIGGDGATRIGGTAGATGAHAINGASVTMNLTSAPASFSWTTSGTPGGYVTNFNMDATGLKIGHNSSSRDFQLQTNSTTYFTISGAGALSWGAVGSTASHVAYGSDTQFRGAASTTTTIGFYMSSTRYSYIGVSGASNGIISGSSAGDTVIRADNFNMLFSANAGTTAHLKISSGGLSTFTSTDTSSNVVLVQAPASFTYSLGALQVAVATNSGTGFYIQSWTTANDTEMRIRGDGNLYVDNTTIAGTADYAEYFESANGEALPIGATVVFEGGKVRVAVDGDNPADVVGVVRPVGASIVANAATERWAGKYLRDVFGAYIHDANGERMVNPQWDPEAPYVSREVRPEWNVIGLVGQVVLIPGQVTHPNWRKMETLDGGCEKWFIR